MKNFFGILLFGLFLGSCARVGSPNGGAKDSLSPVFLKSNIDTSRVNISTKLRELRLDFDEYIVLKEINKNLIISPPIQKIKKILPSNLANKYILIQWEEDLRENTTYNFNFGNAIADNNEGNILPYFNFAFSTGNHIDNLYISGDIKDAMFPEKTTSKNNVVVSLYPENSDFRQKPTYITKSDEDGYFELNYLQKGDYKLLAFEDENQNSVYDAGKEKVAFLRENIRLSENISGLELNLYPSKKAVKYKELKKIEGGILLLFEGKPNKVEVKILEENEQNWVANHQPKSDSVRIWINDKRLFSKNLKISYSTKEKQDTLSAIYTGSERQDLSLSNHIGALLSPSQDFMINSNMDLAQISPEKWILKQDSVSQKFNAIISEKDADKIILSSDFQPGKKYTLSIPKESVSGHFYSNKKSYIFNFEIDKAENYGSLVLKLNQTPESKFWIELIDNKGIVKYKKYINQQEIRFTDLKPGNYFARILMDSNKNEFWDEADFSEKNLAEEVFVFPKELNIRAMWEIVEEWNFLK